MLACVLHLPSHICSIVYTIHYVYVNVNRFHLPLDRRFQVQYTVLYTCQYTRCVLWCPVHRPCTAPCSYLFLLRLGPRWLLCCGVMHGWPTVYLSAVIQSYRVYLILFGTTLCPMSYSLSYINSVKTLLVIKIHCHSVCRVTCLLFCFVNEERMGDVSRSVHCGDFPPESI